MTAHTPRDHKWHDHAPRDHTSHDHTSRDHISHHVTTPRVTPPPRDPTGGPGRRAQQGRTSARCGSAWSQTSTSNLPLWSVQIYPRMCPRMCPRTPQNAPECPRMPRQGGSQYKATAKSTSLPRYLPQDERTLSLTSTSSPLFWSAGLPQNAPERTKPVQVYPESCHTHCQMCHRTCAEADTHTHTEPPALVRTSLPRNHLCS